MLVFYQVLYNGEPATVVNLSNSHFGLYHSEDLPLNLRLHQLDRIKTGDNLPQLRIAYESDKDIEPIELCFFSIADRDEFMENLVEAQLVDEAKCCYLFLPSFLLRSCCGLFRYNQLYVKSKYAAAKAAVSGKKVLKLRKKTDIQPMVIASPPCPPASKAKSTEDWHLLSSFASLFGHRQHAKRDMSTSMATIPLEPFASSTKSARGP